MTEKLQLHPLDASMFLASGKNENLNKIKSVLFFHKHIFPSYLSQKLRALRLLVTVRNVYINS